MPQEKKEKILLYNQQDVVSLFYIYVDWYNKVGMITKEDESQSKCDEAQLSCEEAQQ